MTTAQVLFEQYKVLPRRIQRELKEMIVQEANVVPAETDDDDEGDTIHISMKAFKDSIREVKMLKAGKQNTRPAREALAQTKRELAEEH